MSDEEHRLTVVVGAGASRSCAGAGAELNQRYTPPLTQGLFEAIPPFAAILDKYPGAMALSDEIRTRTRDQSVEDVLQSIAELQDIETQRQYWQVPLYLQELLGDVSANFIVHGPTKFDRLVSEIHRSKYQEVLYLTLNYDLFLEKALVKLYPNIDPRFEKFVDYLPENLPWSLVKVHGSVTWGRRVKNSLEGGTEDAVIRVNTLAAAPDFDEEVVMLRSYLERFRGHQFYYPALAVPLKGGGKKFVCPSAHEEHARRFVARCSNFLILGFGALDNDVLELLSMVTHLRNPYVVDRNREEAINTLGRISRVSMGFSKLTPVDVTFQGDFSQFVDRDLARFLGA